MHCVSARARSKRVLNDTLVVKHSTKINNNLVSDFEVVGLSFDDDEKYVTTVDFEEEEVTEASDCDINVMESDHDGVLVVSDIKKEDNEDHIAKELTKKSKRGRRKWQKSESEVGGTKRRKVHELDILVDESNSEEKKCAAQRTHFHFCSNNKSKKKLMLGTIAQLICIDDDENEEEKVGDFHEEVSKSKSDGEVFMEEPMKNEFNLGKDLLHGFLLCMSNQNHKKNQRKRKKWMHCGVS